MKSVITTYFMLGFVQAFEGMKTIDVHGPGSTLLEDEEGSKEGPPGLVLAARGSDRDRNRLVRRDHPDPGVPGWQPNWHPGKIPVGGTEGTPTQIVASNFDNSAISGNYRPMKPEDLPAGADWKTLMRSTLPFIKVGDGSHFLYRAKTGIWKFHTSNMLSSVLVAGAQTGIAHEGAVCDLTRQTCGNWKETASLLDEDDLLEEIDDMDNSMDAIGLTEVMSRKYAPRRRRTPDHTDINAPAPPGFDNINGVHVARRRPAANDNVGAPAQGTPGRGGSQGMTWPI